jgi:HlyD family secretion protein
LVGYLALAIFGGGFLGWGWLFTIDGAVIARGQFVLDGSTKKIQHHTGGIVREIAVRDGDLVQEGALLVRLDDTALRSSLNVVSNQLVELEARVARLQAERDGHAVITFTEALVARRIDAEIEQIMAAEIRFFEARRTSRAGARAQLEKKISQHRSEIMGFKAQLQARTKEIELNRRELNGVRQLYKQNLVAISRLSQLERDAASLEGQIETLSSQVMLTESRIAEAELQIHQIVETLQTEVLRELSDAHARIAELQERAVAAGDQLKRMEIRAPVRGYVHQLSVHSSGAVVSPAEPIMQIVPSNDHVVLEAKIAPTDVDQIAPGQKATIRIQAFNQRTTPQLNGVVARISPDVMREQATGAIYYSVRISVPATEFERLKPLSISPGMQSEVYLRTGARTPISFLMKPLTDHFSRAMRER